MMIPERIKSGGWLPLAASCWLLLLTSSEVSGAALAPKLFVNDDLKECADPVILGDECAVCYPRNGWRDAGFSHDPDVVCPVEYVTTSSTIPPMLCEEQPGLSLRICCTDFFSANGACDNLAFNWEEEKCAATRCLPEVWTTEPPVESEGICPFYYEWVGSEELECDDPCQALESCSTCLATGCTWSFIGQTCSPDKWRSPYLPGDMSYDELCQEIEEILTETRTHRFIFYIKPDVFGPEGLDNATKNALAQYVADMNFVITKNTMRELLFDPDTDIVIVNDTFPEYGTYVGSDFPVEFDIWALVEKSTWFASYGGYPSFAMDGSGVISSLRWLQIYEPTTLEPDTNETRDYWRQMNSLLYAFEHNYGAGVSEYYSLNLVEDLTDVPPLLGMNNLFKTGDPYWQDKQDFLFDPLLQSIYNKDVAGNPVSRDELLAKAKFSKLSAAVVNHNSRRPPYVDHLADGITISLVDSDTLEPIVGADIKIWNVRSFSPYNNQLLYNETGATDAVGTYVFDWDPPGYTGGNIHGNYNHLRLIKIYKDGYRPIAMYRSVFDAEIVKVLQGLDKWTIDVEMIALPCFESTSELQDAVAQYMINPSDQDADVAKTYGWPIGTWCVSNIEDFSYLFEGYTNWSEDISGWDMSNAKNLNRMFERCSSFDQPLDSWDVSSVQSMEMMFADCVSFDYPLNSWNVSNVENMGGMFNGCTLFNQPLHNWDVSNVVNMGFMFYYCSLFNQDIGGWDVSNVRDMGVMFSHCPSFDQDLSQWDVSKVYFISEMFSDSVVFNHDLSAWNVSSVKYITRMFYGASSFSQSLCSWGSHLQGDLDFGDMFNDTKCPDQHSPDMNSTPVNHLCMECDMTCGDPQYGSGTGLPCIFDEDVCVDDATGGVVDLTCCSIYNNKYVSAEYGCLHVSQFADECGDNNIELGESCQTSWARARCFDEDDALIDMFCCPYKGYVFSRMGELCICFSGENFVRELTKGDIKMKELAIGDMVEVGHNKYDQVYGFGHNAPDGTAEYLQIHVDGVPKPLEITRNHMIFVENEFLHRSTPASNVKVGDKIILGNDDEMGQVTSIKVVERTGLYAPLTTSGKLMVSGVLASNYVSLQDNASTLHIGGYPTPFSMQWLAHAFTFHRRMLCSLNFALCQKESYYDNGMPEWISGAFRFFTWLLDQNMTLQLLVLVPFVAYSCLVSMVEFVTPSLTLILLSPIAITVGYDYATNVVRSVVEHTAEKKVTKD